MGEDENTPTRIEEPVTDQSNDEDSSDMFTGPAAEENYVGLQRDLFE